MEKRFFDKVKYLPWLMVIVAIIVIVFVMGCATPALNSEAAKPRAETGTEYHYVVTADGMMVSYYSNVQPLLWAAPSSRLAPPLITSRESTYVHARGESLLAIPHYEGKGTEWAWPLIDGANYWVSFTTDQCNRVEGVESWYLREFEVTDIATGTLSIAYDDHYYVWLNGELVGSGSTWREVDTYDIDLQAGTNTLWVYVLNQATYIHPCNPTGVAFKIEAN